jgi:hypothetical protein
VVATNQATFQAVAEGVAALCTSLLPGHQVELAALDPRDASQGAQLR